MARPIPPYAAGAWIVDDTVELKSLLGVGGYAYVYRALDHTKSPPAEFAVKCVLHETPDPIKDELLRREITFHKQASGGQHVVSLRRIVHQEDRTFLFMDLCRGGDLYTAISSGARFEGNDALIKRVFLQIVDAIQYLHKRKIYHRDLKPENILFRDSESMHVLLTDFGLSTCEAFSNEYRFGSSGYMSPECFNRDYDFDAKYSSRHSDIWGLGILLINMITGRNPWEKASIEDENFMLYMESPEGFFRRLFPIPVEVEQLLSRTLALDWRERMTLSELRKAVTRIDRFSRDFNDAFVKEYVLDFTNDKAQTSVRVVPAEDMEVGSDTIHEEDVSSHLLPDGAFTSANHTPFSPASASDTSDSDYFYAPGWRSYLTPPHSRTACTTPTPPRIPAMPDLVHTPSVTQCPTPQTPATPASGSSMLAPPGLETGDMGIVELECPTAGGSGLRSGWSYDSDSEERRVERNVEVVARRAVGLPIPPREKKVSTVRRRLTVTVSWFKRPFQAARRRLSVPAAGSTS